jgi:hypothetical protein
LPWLASKHQLQVSSISDQETTLLHLKALVVTRPDFESADVRSYEWQNDGRRRCVFDKLPREGEYADMSGIRPEGFSLKGFREREECSDVWRFGPVKKWGRQTVMLSKPKHHRIVGAIVHIEAKIEGSLGLPVKLLKGLGGVALKPVSSSSMERSLQLEDFAPMPPEQHRI